MPTLEEAIEHIRMGNRDVGRQILEEILDEDDQNEEVWLWLSSVVDSDEDREICLENVLALNPDNVVAQKGLEALQSGTFNVSDLFGDVLEDVGEESETTFLDDFMAAGEEDEEEDELIFPGSMAKPQKKRGGGINIRFVIIAVLVIVLVIVLGGVGAAYIFLVADGGGGTPVESPSSQETPGEVAPSTETPTPTPTVTPTPTNTPDLRLPTAAPTRTPSPTATQVVSPTPSGGG